LKQALNKGKTSTPQVSIDASPSIASDGSLTDTELGLLQQDNVPWIFSPSSINKLINFFNYFSLWMLSIKLRIQMAGAHMRIQLLIPISTMRKVKNVESFWKGIGKNYFKSKLLLNVF